MNVISPIILGSLLALFTGIQVWINKGRFDSFEERVEKQFEHLSGEIAAARTDLGADIAAVRSDLLQVALAASGRRQTSS